MEKYIVGVVLMDKNGKIYCWCYFDVKILTIFCIYFVLMDKNRKIYRWCYFDVKILTTFCIDFVLMIQNVRGKNCIGVGVWPWDLIAIQWCISFQSEKVIIPS